MSVREDPTPALISLKISNNEEGGIIELTVQSDDGLEAVESTFNRILSRISSFLHGKGGGPEVDVV
jgi:hypothetical protein